MSFVFLLDHGIWSDRLRISSKLSGLHPSSLTGRDQDGPLIRHPYIGTDFCPISTVKVGGRRSGRTNPYGTYTGDRVDRKTTVFVLRNPTRPPSIKRPVTLVHLSRKGIGPKRSLHDGGKMSRTSHQYYPHIINTEMSARLSTQNFEDGVSGSWRKGLMKTTVKRLYDLVY